MINKTLQIKGVKELKYSSLKVINGGNDTNSCSDDPENINLLEYVDQPGTPFLG